MPADIKLMRKIKDILREDFPLDTVDVSPGYYRDDIHVVVMSRKFDGMKEKKKQNFLWSLIDKGNPKGHLTEGEKSKIRLIMPLSPEEVGGGRLKASKV